MMARVYIAAEFPCRDARQFLSWDDLDGMRVLTFVLRFLTMTCHGWDVLN